MNSFLTINIYKYADFNTALSISLTSPDIFNNYYSLLRKKYYNYMKQRLEKQQPYHHGIIFYKQFSGDGLYAISKHDFCIKCCKIIYVKQPSIMYNMMWTSPLEL